MDTHASLQACTRILLAGRLQSFRRSVNEHMPCAPVSLRIEAGNPFYSDKRRGEFFQQVLFD